MKVGVTGTRDGMTLEQRKEFRRLIKEIQKEHGITEFHHGDCVGVDIEAAAIVALHTEAIIHSHPPSDPSQRGFGKFTSKDVLHESKPYLERNRDIVDNVDLLIAVPSTIKMVIRSGTWATVRYAQRIKRRVILIQRK